MTNYIGWTPPPGVAVVPSPVHPETRIDLIYSDGQIVYGTYGPRHNWSGVGDGPSIVAYAVVEEYKPAPEDFWIVRWDNGGRCSFTNVESADDYAAQLSFENARVIHVREVMPAAREVVAWAVVDGNSLNCFYEKKWADNFVEQRGGTVVRLTGAMPS
jgi:hypothetical protein